MDGEPIDTGTRYEEPKENSSEVLFNNMRRELGEDEFQNHQYVTDIFKLRAEVNPLLKAEDKTGAVAKVRESRMWKDYTSIQTELFTADELKQVIDLDTALRNPEVMQPLKDALMQFLKYRHELSWNTWRKDDTDEAKRKEKTDRAVQHLVDVANFTEKLNASPLATLLALVHDVEKYAGDQTLLAEHEVASSVIGGEILQSLFQSTVKLKDKKMDVSAYAGVMKKLARKLFTHGEYEFTDLNAKVITDKKEDDNIRTLFNGIYIKPNESSLIPLRQSSAYDETSVKATYLARGVLEQVSIADKHMGIKDLDKVFDDVSGTHIEGTNVNPWTTVENISNTVIENQIAADIIGPLTPGTEAYEESNRWRKTNLLILYLIKRAEELHTQEDKNYLAEFKDAFRLDSTSGRETDAATIDRLEMMLFNAILSRTIFDTPDEAAENKSVYTSVFHNMYDFLHDTKFSIVEGTTLAKNLKQLEEDLTQKWISAHSALKKPARDS